MNFQNIISLLNSFPIELLIFIKFLACGFIILGTFRFFGLAGLYIYTAVAVIAANIAVLKQVQFPFYPTPMAVGSIIFTSLFLCSDLINEYYGKKASLKAIGLGFLAYFLMITLITLILGYKPLDQEIQNSINLLFIPAPTLFVASIIAYLASQYTDIFIYRFIYNKTGKSMLWLRAAFSSLIASFIDNTIFSILAWELFALHPLPFQKIFWTYIFGASILRFILSIGNIGFMYLSKIIKSSSNETCTLS